VELLVGALVVLGFVAILTRFIARDASGEVRLPRVVDDSIGMWVLRRATGRSFGQRPADDEVDEIDAIRPAVGDPHSWDATRAALAAIAAANAADGAIEPTYPAPAPSAYAGSAPAQSPGPRPAPAFVLTPRRPAMTQPVRSSTMLSPTPVLDLRRRLAAQQAGQQARPRKRRRWRRRLVAFGSLAAVLALAVGALAFALQPGGPISRALNTIGQPTPTPTSASPSPLIAVEASLAPASEEPAPASAQASIEPATTLPADTPLPTSKATARPTARPTAQSTPVATPVPTPRPTAKPTPKPTATLPPAPVAKFSFVQIGNDVTFTNRSTGTGLSLLWDFGDGGQTSNEPNPIHHYADGTYDVKLTVTDQYGRTDWDIQTLNVPPLP
jgi:hypothetical protein